MEKDVKDLLIDELHDILSSEEQIIKALPEMAKAAQTPELKKAFETHLKETKGQVKRLDMIFKILKVKKQKKFCKGTKGLIDEGKEVLKDMKKKSLARDAALISKAQRIEHYEISAYGTARAFAQVLDLGNVADLLEATLIEEEGADIKLTGISVGGLLTNIEKIAHSKSKPAKKVIERTQKKVATPTKKKTAARK